MSLSANEDTLHQAIHTEAFREALPAYIRERRWFGGKSRTIRSASIADAVPLPGNAPLAYLCFVQLEYEIGPSDTYALPLALANGPQASELRRSAPQALVLTVEELTGDGALYDATYDPAFCSLLLGIIERDERFAGSEGLLHGEPTRAFAKLRGTGELAPRISLAEQSNTSIIYSDRLILKLFRRIVPGLNPDLELGRYLTEQGQFVQIAPVAGSLSYASTAAEPVTLGMLLGFVPNRGDAWSYMLELLEQLKQLAEVRSQQSERNQRSEATFGEYDFEPSLMAVWQLGQRTGEMHMALAAPTSDAAFAPEPFTQQQAIAEVAAMNALTDQVVQTTRERLAQQPSDVQPMLQQILSSEAAIRARFAVLATTPLTALCTRTHGDYHLGQVLVTPDEDFVIIDFEGEPARSLAERRIKRSPLRDLAGMLRSFEYAMATVVAGDPQHAVWARWWVTEAKEQFLRGYYLTAGTATFLPTTYSERDVLLDAYLIEKAVYELQYELNNRPAWVPIPVQGILRLVGEHN